MKWKEKEYKAWIAKAPKIKCPYCEKWFPNIVERVTYGEDIDPDVKKAFELAIEAREFMPDMNKTFIRCPNCKMKVMFGID